MPSLDEMLSDMPLHRNFYVRGLVNSFLPDFMNPLDDKITEKSLSGEALTMLHGVVQEFFSDLKEGQVQSIDYKMINEKYNLDSVMRGNADMGNFMNQIKMALGEFAVTKENGQFVIIDKYDFPDVGNWKEFPELESAADYIGASFSKPSMTEYFGARFIAERTMNESQGADENLRVRITLPNEPEVIATDYDNDIPENATSFVFEGPMTTKRKSIFDAFISTAQAGTLNDNVDLANLTDLSTERDLRVGDFKPFPMDGNDEEGRMNEAQRALLDSDE